MAASKANVRSAVRLGFLALLTSSSVVEALNCSIDPYVVPFKNVTILNYPDAFSAHRGIEMQIGALDVKLSMNLATTVNSSFFPDGDKVCSQTAFDARQCIFWRGGLFTPANSSSWVWDKGTEPYNGAASNEGFDYLNWRSYGGGDPLGNFPRGWDNVIIGGKQIPSYPLTDITNSSFPFGAGMLGMASDSQFLEYTVKSNISASRTWALDYGLINSPGEFVVGGYNSKKATYQDFTNFTVFPDKTIPCPLQVRVANIKLGSTSISSTPFTACLEPAVWSMVLPLAAQSEFNKTVLKETNGLKFWKNTWEYAYYNVSGTNLPAEDMTIELEGGFSVTIPKSELFDTAKELIPSGGWSPINGVQQAALGTAGFPPNVPPLPQFGAPFLSQVYVVVNYENNSFSLAKTHRDASSTPSLVRLACDHLVTDPIKTSSSDSDSSSNTGAIVGGVVGGIGGLALISVAVWFFLRRRKQNAAAGAAGAPGSEGAHPGMHTPMAPAGWEAKAQGHNPGQDYHGVNPPAYQSPASPPPQGHYVHETDGRLAVQELQG